MMAAMRRARPSANRPIRALLLVSTTSGRSDQVGWETLLNRAGTTFKKLPDKDKDGVTEKKAIALMLAQPSMIKRPELELGGGKLLVGFRPEEYDAALK